MTKLLHDHTFWITGLWVGTAFVDAGIFASSNPMTAAGIAMWVMCAWYLIEWK